MKKFYLKKQLLFFAFITSFYILNGQIINDNFENESISNWTQSNTNDWAIDSEAPITQSQSLKHNLTSVSGTSYISQSTSDVDLNNKDTSWQFNIKNGNWNPSSGNKFWVYLTANASNLNSETLNGYAVGVNLSGTTDIITLWKVTNGSVDETLITSTTAWGTGETKGIRVTRSIIGEWNLFIDADGGFDNLTIAGAPIINTDYLFTNYFGLHFTYTSTRAGLLWLDDVLIENTESSIEPLISFENLTTSVTEPNTISNILIPITLSNHTTNVEIAISLDPNSTVEIDDYTLNTSSLTFTANGSQNIPITINDDADFNNETIILNITVTSGDADIVTSQHAITIIDNDASLVINEIYADPDATNGDANGDGIISSSQDEFIEIYNNKNSDLDISGWVLADATKDRHVFKDNTIIPANQTIVIFSGGDITSVPGLTQLASSGSLVLNNSGDTITIKNESGIEILSETYGSIAGNNQSIARDDDVTGAFVQHSTISTNPLLFSPGRDNTTNLTSFSAILNISDIHQNKTIDIFQSSKNELTIIGLQGNANFKIFSLRAEEIISENITSYQETSKIILPNLGPGIYIIKIKSKLNEVTKKLILE